MKTVQVYDKPMCCSTGVCGPDVDPVLPRFAADLEWLKSQGCQVNRFNLAQQPQAFIENQLIHQLLSTAGTDCLPVVVVDGQITSQSVYPTREMLASWTADSTTARTLPMAAIGGGCCGGSAKATDSCCSADQPIAEIKIGGCGCDDSGCC